MEPENRHTAELQLVVGTQRSLIIDRAAGVIVVERVVGEVLAGRVVRRLRVALAGGHHTRECLVQHGDVARSGLRDIQLEPWAVRSRLACTGAEPRGRRGDKGGPGAPSDAKFPADRGTGAFVQC
jgi:hypothetical protein